MYSIGNNSLFKNILNEKVCLFDKLNAMKNNEGLIMDKHKQQGTKNESQMNNASKQQVSFTESERNSVKKTTAGSDRLGQ